MPDEITLSRETLRAELAQLELRLVDRLTQALDGKADHAVVEAQNQRITVLELSRAARETLPTEINDVEKRVTRLERFRYAVPSVAALSAVAAIVMATVTLIHL